MSSGSRPEWSGYMDVSVKAIAASILIILVSVHAKNVMLDFQDQKKTNKSRGSASNAAAIFILLSISFYAIQLIMNFIMDFDFIMDLCSVLVPVNIFFYIFGKIFMYISFLIKLHIVYRSTIFEYNETKLKIAGCCIVIPSILFLITTCLTSPVEPFYYDDQDVLIACNIIMSASGFGTIMIDLICTFSFMFAFVQPLKKLIKSMEEVTNSKNIMAAGTKVMILTSTASISSFLFLIFIFILNAIASLLLSIDIVLNVICLMLMTRYYSKGKCFSYKGICCGIINCVTVCCGGCVEGGVTYNTRYAQDNAKTVDTVNSDEMTSDVGSTEVGSKDMTISTMPDSKTAPTITITETASV